MDDPETFDLDVDGLPVKATVIRQQSEALAAWGFPHDQAVYDVTWGDSVPMDRTPTGRCACAGRRGRRAR